MTQEKIFEDICQIMEQHLEVKEPLLWETRLLRDLHFDSLQLMTLVVEVENHFQTCFAPGDEENLVTVGDVVSLLRFRLDEPDC